LFLKYVFANVFTYSIYNSISILRKKLRRFLYKNKRLNKKKIFAPHGSLLIFNNLDFLKSLPKHFCFLYGEELLVGKESQRLGLDIIYDPSIRAVHTVHGTLEKIPIKNLQSYYHSMVEGYIKRYVDV
ncbi:MAG: hypothetical protein VX986_04375, partial [Pseudomonadota bacterium]|nr:hypothetical protein [Pseudomonadota bacterium]